MKYFPDESSELSPDGISALSSSFDSSKKNAVINVNESIISLMLKLHSKYSGRRDSYVPIFQRKGFSTEKEYRYVCRRRYLLTWNNLGHKWRHAILSILDTTKDHVLMTPHTHDKFWA